MPIQRPELTDKTKEIKSKGNTFDHDVRKDLTEDQGKMPETHEFKNEGQVVARYVKKDGKVLQSVATQDVQESGAFDDLSKKVGDKDPTFTSPAMAGAQAGLKAHKEQGDMGEAESPLSDDLEKSDEETKENTTRLIQAVRRMTGKDRPDYDPHTDGKEVADKIRSVIAKAKLKKNDTKEIRRRAQLRAAFQSVREGARGEEVNQERPKEGTSSTPSLKDEPKENVLNYAEINKPKKVDDSNAPTINYKELGPTPPRPPRWQRNQAIKREQKEKAIANKHPDVIMNDKPASFPAKSKIEKAESSSDCAYKLLRMKDRLKKMDHTKMREAGHVGSDFAPTVRSAAPSNSPRAQAHVDAAVAHLEKLYAEGKLPGLTPPKKEGK